MITDLNKLIGKKVKFEVEPNKIVKCKIESAYLDEYSFFEKSDQMNVFVNLIPLNYDANKDYDILDFKGVALTHVRKI